MQLAADCARCSGLCCVVLPLTRSADFPIDKPAGVRCLHLRNDFACDIHAELQVRGFRGCVAFDCFGAGQRATESGRTDEFGPLLRLHELLWYLSDAAERVPDATLRASLVSAYDRTERLAAAPAGVDVAAQRDSVAPLLREASAAIRRPGARSYPTDLAGASLLGADLSDADLRGVVLIAADLRDAVLSRTDLIGADLRGADLSGADLEQALYLTRTQINSARGDATTRLPLRLSRPDHWPAH
jgi:hypothetical protein